MMNARYNFVGLSGINLDRLRLKGVIFPISAVSSTPFHLLYVVDILVFLIPHKPDLRRLQGLRRLYQDSSGQSFNLQKIQLFLGNYNARSENMVASLED